jgi:hypothetical protein
MRGLSRRGSISSGRWCDCPARLTTEDVASLDPLVRDRLMTTLQIPRRR